MAVYEELIPANEQYAAAFGDKTSLPLPPAKKLAVGK